MQKILPDTNVFIDWLNRGRYGELLLAKGVLKYVSAVVLLELEAGAFFRRDQRLVEQLARGFEQVRRIVVPTASDYRDGGKLLRRLQEEKGYELHKTYSLINDVLIALCARRIGAMILTQNAKDFEAIREFLSFSLVVV
ncbi:MAG: type II toxin-antitoxin system VapC family toxin [Candidatus Bipolaricaulia bacterium]